MSSKGLDKTIDPDKVIIVRNQEEKVKLAPETGYGSTKITWRNGKIAQIEHSETEK